MEVEVSSDGIMAPAAFPLMPGGLAPHLVLVPLLSLPTIQLKTEQPERVRRERETRTRNRPYSILGNGGAGITRRHMMYMLADDVV